MKREDESPEVALARRRVSDGWNMAGRNAPQVDAITLLAEVDRLRSLLATPAAPQGQVEVLLGALVDAGSLLFSARNALKAKGVPVAGIEQWMDETYPNALAAYRAGAPQGERRGDAGTLPSSQIPKEQSGGAAVRCATERCGYAESLEREIERLNSELTERPNRLESSREAIIRAELEAAERTERKYPCARCGTLRSRDEGGTTFTTCDACWDRDNGKPAIDVPSAGRGRKP